MAARLLLVIGNYNYSSWSLRPWLALEMSGLEFRSERIPLYQDDTKAGIRAHSPAGTVPVLEHGELVLWESLAICEYVAELAPGAQLWPSDAFVRARARSVATEMHGGFPAMRKELPLNFRGKAKRTPELSADARAQVARIEESWSDCLARAGGGGPFLFGRFSIADAMYAPVASRFRTYGVKLGPAASAYADAVLALPAMQKWGAEAARESERVDLYDRLLA
jgi:glutathione S-transferase